MAELITVARPYAKAAFEYALEAGVLPKWLNIFDTLALLVQDPQVRSLLHDPKVSDSQLAGLFIGMLGSELDSEAENFINLLASRSRFAALPYIRDIYTELYAEQQKTITAKVYTTQELNPAQAEKLKQAMAQRLDREVELETVIDPTIFGGVRVEAGDLVIDGTIQGRLQRLFENFNA